MENQLVRLALKQYIAAAPRERGVSTMRAALRRKAALTSRKSFFAHVTASAVVVDATFTNILLIKHNFLQKLIQPGGHLDANDRSMVDAAKRELYEETGLDDVIPFGLPGGNPNTPFDIDVHRIPKNEKKQEPAHYHIDCRYLFVSTGRRMLTIDTREVSRAAWHALDEVLAFDHGFTQLVAKIREYHASQRDSIFFRILAHDFHLAPEKRNIVAVMHVLPDIPNFIAALKRYASSVVIIAKPNSIHRPTLQALRRERILHLTREDLSHGATLDKLFQRPEPYFVLDIGGYFANARVMQWNRKHKKILGIVEDTENGYQKYVALRKQLRIPVVSVARSHLKSNEDDLVGYNVAYFTEMVLREIRAFPRQLTCGIIGYGKLGRGIAKYLFNQNVKPLLYDLKAVRMVEGFKDGCVPVSKATMLASADIIFCATGSKSLHDDDFAHVKIGAAIASVTSSDDEFDLRGIAKHFTCRSVSPHVTRLENRTRFFHLINNGNAVNFIGGEQVGNFIRLVQAEILANFKEIAQGKVTLGIHESRDTFEQRIANIFLQVYLQLKAVPNT